MSSVERLLSPGLRNPVAFGLVLLAGACSPEPTTTAIDTEDQAADLTPLSLSEASSEFSQSGLRIGVRVRGSDPLVATLLVFGPRDAALEPERVEANVTGLEETEGGGTITTNLGGLGISFDASTSFGRDGSDASLTADEFITAIRSALDAGRHPHIAARRVPPSSPQAPDDGTFLADRIRLGGTTDGLWIDLNVGPGGFELNANPPPDAFLKVLDLTIEIRISDGTTVIGRRHDDIDREVEFADRVKSVHLERRAFVLASGATVLVTDRTEIGGDVESLADVAAALEAGYAVGAEGKGTLVSRDPRVISATRVRFEKRPRLLEFKDGVKAADLDARTITLASGAVLCFNDQSVIDPDGNFTSLEQVARALSAGIDVAATGAAAPGPYASGCRATVVKIRFVTRPPPVTEFRDLVKSVSLDAQAMTLASGATLCFNDHSVISQEGDLKSLAEVARALDAGKRVTAAGAVTPGPSITACRATVVKVRFQVVTPTTGG